jgi:hypothetical protein
LVIGSASIAAILAARCCAGESWLGLWLIQLIRQTTGFVLRLSNVRSKHCESRVSTVLRIARFVSSRARGALNTNHEKTVFLSGGTTERRRCDSRDVQTIGAGDSLDLVAATLFV